MMPSPDCFNLIRRFEGFSARPYRCPAGLLTIGYGHVLVDDETWDGISVEQANALLRQDAMVAADAVRRLIRVTLAQYQYDALVSFTFNLGAAAFQRSTLRQKVNRAEHAMAAEEFGRWVFGGGKKLAGLVRRRQAEAALYLGFPLVS